VPTAVYDLEAHVLLRQWSSLLCCPLNSHCIEEVGIWCCCWMFIAAQYLYDRLF
jgi:hypothetical protein